MWLLIHAEIKVSKRGPRWKAGWNGHMLSLFVNDLLGNRYKISMNITNHLYFLLTDLCCDMESKCVEIYFHQIYLRCNLHSKTYCYLMDLNLNLNLKIVYLTRKKYKHDTISHRVHDSMFFVVVVRPLQMRWAHRLRKGHSRVLQCIDRHCTMKCQTYWGRWQVKHTHFLGQNAI